MSAELTVIDAKATDTTTPGTALVTRVEPRPPVRLLQPIAAPAEIMAAQNATRTLIQKALDKGRDYGTVKGIDKPMLLKPGAERIVLAFGCYARFTVVESEIDHDREVRWSKRKKRYRDEYQGDKRFDWIEDAGTSLGLYRYVVRCDIVSRETETVVGSCAGSCSTLESKYIDRPRDMENTVLKMAVKRSLVGAVLITYGLSDQFTQDLDDWDPEEHTTAAPSGAAPSAPSRAPVAGAKAAPQPAPAAPPKRQKKDMTPEETISFIRDENQPLDRRQKAVSYLFAQAPDTGAVNAYFGAIMQYADSAEGKAHGGEALADTATDALHDRLDELMPTTDTVVDAESVADEA